VLTTDRLILVPATDATVSASLHSNEQLAAALDAIVPGTWPPDLLDRGALEWTLAWLRTPGNDLAWGMHFIVLRQPRTLVGVVGYKGMPVEGTVEVGYGVVAEHQRLGIATEATRALVEHAFKSPRVSRVIAETLPDLVPSIGVLDKCGFSYLGEGSEAGVIRYEVRRKP
jgi:ribosomal-protein-alanine N-acetyltransferase